VHVDQPVVRHVADDRGGQRRLEREVLDVLAYLHARRLGVDHQERLAATLGGNDSHVCEDSNPL
jgi:hypothetical protein